MSTAVSQTKVVTGRCRGSYVNVFRPRVDDKGQEKYSICLLIPKSDTQTIAKLKAAIEAAKVKKFGAKAPAGLKTPIRDGDVDRADDPAYKGHFFLNASSKDKPGVIDGGKNEILDPRAFVSGDYCRASLNAFYYDNSGNKGISFGLNNVQVLERGEPLSSRSRAEDDFDVVDGADSEPQF